jgi:hypothetical protein
MLQNANSLQAQSRRKSRSGLCSKPNLQQANLTVTVPSLLADGDVAAHITASSNLTVLAAAVPYLRIRMRRIAFLYIEQNACMR